MVARNTIALTLSPPYLFFIGKGKDVGMDLCVIVLPAAIIPAFHISQWFLACSYMYTIPSSYFIFIPVIITR